MSIFLKTNHLFLRNPNGGVENIVDMREAGFEAIFCNIGDHQPHEWDTVRTRAANAGVVCGPWLRTADASNNFSPARLDFLIQIADRWGAPLIVNSESEIKASGKDITSLIANKVGERDAAVSVECWPFANVEWWPIAHLPVLPQIFPQETEVAKNPEAIRKQWHAYGIKCVVDTFGSYHEQPPNTFNRLTPYGVYTADDCGANYKAWASQGTHNPCVRGSEPEEPGDTVEKIGAQSGVKALAQKFRSEWPTLAGKPDPEDHTTWKAIDKWERTMLILIRDHDNNAD